MLLEERVLTSDREKHWCRSRSKLLYFGCEVESTARWQLLGQQVKIFEEDTVPRGSAGKQVLPPGERLQGLSINIGLQKQLGAEPKVGAQQQSRQKILSACISMCVQETCFHAGKVATLPYGERRMTCF